jgi:hypothetical protein
MDIKEQHVPRRLTHERSSSVRIPYVLFVVPILELERKGDVVRQLLPFLAFIAVALHPVPPRLNLEVLRCLRMMMTRMMRTNFIFKKKRYLFLTLSPSCLTNSRCRHQHLLRTRAAQCSVVLVDGE